VRTTPVVELPEPIALASRPGSGDLYIAGKNGQVWRVVVSRSTTGTVTYQRDPQPVIDLSSEVIDSGERGLLGLAFASDGAHLFLDYTRQPDGATVIEEVTLDDDPVSPDDRRQLLLVAQPFPNHNGGQLVLGPDGYLYIGLGDGGSGGDPNGNGQNTARLLGKILRIDPDGARAAGAAYAVPGGNPFIAGGGRPEVWLYGVRNPWRFTFDRATGDLWVADVGQGAWEEVDLLLASKGRDAGRAANLGWNRLEGSHPYEGGRNPSGGVLPVFEYGHDEGCSITGGYRYRGTAIPDLVGVYLFADYCQPGIRGLQVSDAGAVTAHRRWDLPVDQLQSFGEDADGELYLLLAGGRVLALAAG
jgi:hypothetical protein